MTTLLLPPSVARPFPLPPLDGMQDEVRLAFLHEQVLQWADPRLGAALEIGVYKGCSTVVLADACRCVGLEQLTAIDLFTGTAGWNQREDTEAAARARLAEFGFAGFVELVRGDSAVVPWGNDLAVLHVDGDHRYESVARDIRRFTPLLAPGGIVVFDDYDQAHPGVLRAVHELLAGAPGLAAPGFTIVGVNNHREHTGSICLRRLWRSADGS
ncbi:MAG: class I SAM-dependent methyltransferase [Planctomycetes bacterium]|nr:class I SAM-dependent methyltransferase [Planctomycetota bacterium]